MSRPRTRVKSTLPYIRSQEPLGRPLQQEWGYGGHANLFVSTPGHYGDIVWESFNIYYACLIKCRFCSNFIILSKPCPVPFRTCICFKVETILPWTCHVYGPFEFRKSLGTSMLPLPSSLIYNVLKLFCGYKYTRSFMINRIWGLQQR